MLFYPQYDYLVSVPMLVLPSLVYMLSAVMMSRRWPAGKRLEVKNAMRLYNVVQIVLCAYMTWGLWPVVSFPNVFGLNSGFTDRGEWFVLVHYLSKYLDWFDTIFIVLKDNTTKQLSLLHVYHHGSIGVVWGLLLRKGAGNGSARYGALINSITHVLMYSHYLWTSFGFKNPFRDLLTKWQIFQFYTCITHSVLVLTGIPIVETRIPRNLAWIEFAYHVTMIYLFTFKLRWVPNIYLSASSRLKKRQALKGKRMANSESSASLPDSSIGVTKKRD